LSNAVKFTPAGGRVDVAVAQSAGHVEIRVTDTGVGIDATFLPYVFDRFCQADSTSTRSHGGLGIGLTIVRHIVELHGGTVRAESAGPGKGATFTATLPVAAPPRVEEPPPPAPAREEPRRAPGPPEPNGNGKANGRNGNRKVEPTPRPADIGAGTPLGPRVDLGGVSILVVDDAADALELVAVILRRANARVTTAAGSAEARCLIAQSRPDLLVSDIAMPEEDGFALIRAVRQLPSEQGGQVPALALTAYAREEDRLMALAAGFQGHLTKPIDPDALLAAVAQVLAGATPQPAAR
jgi:CheY-like chemotaxis protein